MINTTETILAQYANSPKLLALIDKFNSAIDPSTLIDDFYNKVWNINTAEGWGLDVWGRIVGVARVVYLPNLSTNFFGFHEAGSWKSWGFAPFWSGDQTGLSKKYVLLDSEYRVLIKAKAAKNISDCSTKSINKILQSLFGSSCYSVDNRDMTMTLVFPTALSTIQLSILLQSDVIPRPIGVRSFIINGTGATPQPIISQQVF